MKKTSEDNVDGKLKKIMEKKKKAIF